MPALVVRRRLPEPVMDERMRDIGLRICELRVQRGFSQKDLAVKVGCEQSAISKWERGDRVINALDLLSLAQALGVTVDALYQKPSLTVEPPQRGRPPKAAEGVEGPVRRIGKKPRND